MLFAIILLSAITIVLMLFVASLMDENIAYRKVITELGHHHEIIRIKQSVMRGEA